MSKQIPRLGAMVCDRLLREELHKRFNQFDILRLSWYQPVVTAETETWKFDLDGRNYKLVLNCYSGIVTFHK
jgi:hypothetical protein